MPIYKRGRVWWINIIGDGIRIRRSTETTDKKLAEKIHAKVLSEITENKWFDRLPGEEKTLNEMMDKYMKVHSAINKSPSTYQREKSTVKHLKSYFGDKIVSRIRPRDIVAYKDKRREDGVSPKTINNELILLGHAFTIAMNEWEWVNSNPARMVSKEKVRNSRTRWLNAAEEKKLLKASPLWLSEIIVFALHTGLRRGEILNLKWSDLDLQRRTLTIYEQKNGSVDTLPINEVVTNLLIEKNKFRSINCDYVFLNKKAKVIDGANLYRAYKKAVKKAGIDDLRFHDLRHSFATRLVQAGVEIYKVQKLMRHKSPQMTQRYAHHFAESLRDGVDALMSCDTNRAQLCHN